MPTGYTAILEKQPNLSFKDFALRCARAMMDDLPRLENEEESYHKHELIEALDELALAKKDKAAAFKKLENRRAYNIKYHLNEIKRKNELGDAYQRMINEVKAWEPPTSDHVGFKDFMLQQLYDSVKWDITTYHEEALKKEKDKKIDEDAYLAYLKELEEDVAYHREHLAEDATRVHKSNTWKTKLFESLEQSGSEVLR